MEPQIVYRIAWYISDPKTYFNYALVCKLFAAAVKHWERPKMTEFTICYQVGNTYRNILPNGVMHGYFEVGGGSIGSYTNKGYWTWNEQKFYSFMCSDWYVKYSFDDSWTTRNHNTDTIVKRRTARMMGPLCDDGAPRNFNVTLCECGGYDYYVYAGDYRSSFRHACALQL